MGGSEAAGQRRVNVRGGQRCAFRNRFVWFLQGAVGRAARRTPRASAPTERDTELRAECGHRAGQSRLLFGYRRQTGAAVPSCGAPVRPRQCGVTEWGVTSSWQLAFVVCPSEFLLLVGVWLLSDATKKSLLFLNQFCCFWTSACESIVVGYHLQ